MNFRLSTRFARRFRREVTAQFSDIIARQMEPSFCGARPQNTATGSRETSHCSSALPRIRTMRSE